MGNQNGSEAGATTTLMIVTFIAHLPQVCLQRGHYKQLMVSRCFKSFHDMCCRGNYAGTSTEVPVFFLIRLIMEREVLKAISHLVSEAGGDSVKALCESR
jgi:hypothetical protein